MIPPENSRVKVLLRNNTVAEGIVKEWGESIKLQSLDEQSYMIILHPNEDIILFKVFLEGNSEEMKISSKYESREETKTELENRFQQVLDQPSDDANRIKSLAELRLLLAQEDRQIIANKLKQHHIGETKKVEYGYPRFLKKPSVE